MIYLLLAILCGTCMSVVMRLSSSRVKCKISMLAVNYLTCVITAVCFIGPKSIFISGGDMPWAIGLGALNGVFFMTALMCNQYSVARTGIVMPSVFSRMGGLLVPLAFSIFMFGELPGIMQVIGAVLAVAGILMMNLRRGGTVSNGCIPALTALLFTEGMASSMTKVYQETGNPAYSDHFLLCTFASAFILCLIVVLLRRERPGIWELIFGMLFGVPNILATRCILKALETVPAIIVYPTRSVGVIALIALIGVAVFKERLSKRQIIALGMIISAVIMLNT